MKRNIIAVALIFAVLMSFASCRKFEDSDAFVVESKVYVVDENGVEQKVETAINAEGQTEYYYINPEGNKVTVNKNDVVIETTKVPKTTNEMFADLTPEEQSFLDSFNDPEALDDLIDSSIETPEMEMAEGLLPEDAFDEIEVELDDEGKPVHDDVKQTYDELIKSNKYTMEINMKGVSNGEETVVPIKTVREGDKIYFETAMPVEGQQGAMKFNVIVKDKQCYLVIPAMRAYMIIPAETMSEFIPSEIITEDENVNLEYVSSGEVVYDNETYLCDVYKDGTTTIKYYYKDGELKRMESIVDENNMSIMEIQSVSAEADSSKFNIPKNYMDMTKFFEGELDLANLSR